MKNKYLKIFECCFPVKGRKNTVIIDPQRGEMYRFPNKYYQYLELLNNNTFNTAEKKAINKIEFNFFIEFLVTNEIAFLTEHKKNFPSISTTFEEPVIISNAIIDTSTDSKYDIFSVIDQLNELGCRHIQFRFYDYKDEEFIFEILSKTHIADKIHSIEIISKYNSKIKQNIYKKLNKKYLKLQSLIFHSAPKDELLHSLIVNNSSMMMVVFTKEEMLSEKDCGKISQDYFITNSLYFILESKSFNNCLNKKISIDKHGNIKNCPSMLKKYGNIKDTTLEEALNEQGFKDLWNIKKDDIKVCQDCEFKFVCSDCRAYTVDNDLYGKPEKCEYSPI